MPVIGVALFMGWCGVRKEGVGGIWLLWAGGAVLPMFCVRCDEFRRGAGREPSGPCPL